MFSRELFLERNPPLPSIPASGVSSEDEPAQPSSPMDIAKQTSSVKGENRSQQGVWGDSGTDLGARSNKAALNSAPSLIKLGQTLSLFEPEVLGGGPLVGGMDDCTQDTIDSPRTGTRRNHTDVRAQSVWWGQVCCR